MLAVKPKDIEPVLKSIHDVFDPKKNLIVSIAAGIRTSTIEKVFSQSIIVQTGLEQRTVSLSCFQLLKPESRVIRVMPNVACLVNASCSVYSSGINATSGNNRFSSEHRILKISFDLLDDLQIVNKIFSSIGSCEGQIEENLLNVVTALSGSGPAYVHIDNYSFSKF